MYRIGHGYDFHRYQAGRPLVLGGVTIPHEVGLLGHSDADALIHALCDALLGALALGDIGKLFPDNDPKNKDRPSREFLQAVMAKVTTANFRVSNADVSVIADHPKLAPYFGKMRELLAALLNVSIDRLGLKATTQEGCQPEGISVHAVVLLQESVEK